MKFGRVALTLAASVLVPSLAAAQMTQTGRLESTGGGLGAQLTLLTLMNPANTTAEEGCITPSAQTCALTGYTFMDAVVQNGQSQVQLLSNAALAGLTGSSVRLTVNVSEPNSDAETAKATLNDLRLLLFGASGNLLFQSVGFTTPDALTQPGNGIGNYGYTYGLTGADIGAFNAALGSAVSVGVAARFTDVTGGLETIAVAQQIAVVPEPATYALVAAGLFGLLVVDRRRRRSA